MSVQTQSFRVVGVNTQSGEDVSIVIDAATKAAAEVKAEQMHIETTHIVRLKADTPEPPDEHELFSSEAAEALAGQRTINLIEECVTHEESRPTPAETASAAESKSAHATPPHQTSPPPPQVVAAITRPSYAAPSSQRDTHGDEVSGMRAFALVLVVLLGISAGAYFVLVHQPNTTTAQDQDLVFGQDLFSDVLEPAAATQSAESVRDAFNNRTASGNTDPKLKAPPIALDQQLHITPAEPASAGGSTNGSTNPPTTESKQPPKLKLQSIVTTNKGRFAVINAKLYKQGASIGSAQLVSVADDWVLIERDGKQFTLQIQSAK